MSNQDFAHANTTKPSEVINNKLVTFIIGTLYTLVFFSIVIVPALIK